MSVTRLWQQGPAGFLRGESTVKDVGKGGGHVAALRTCLGLPNRPLCVWRVSARGLRTVKESAGG